MSRGRPKAVDKELLLEIFNANKIKIVENDKVVAPSAKIWENLSNELEFRMNAKAIYTSAGRWFESLKHIVDSNTRENSGINFSIETTLDLNSTNISSSTNTSSEIRISKDIRFSVTLAYDVWQTINPIAVEYNRKQSEKRCASTRRYFVLKQGVWSNVLLDRVAAHRKNIICSWKFKVCKVYTNGTTYAKMVAKCTSCDATMIGTIRQVPKESDPVKFSFLVQNFNAELHKRIDKSVKNYGIRPAEIAKSSKTAMVLSRERAHTTGKMFEKPKGRQFSANSIRCRRYRDRLEKKLANSPVDALVYLKHSYGYLETIQHVASDPFHVMYRTPNQNLLYNEYKKHNRQTRVTCDGSGNFVHKLARPGDTKSGQILLYNMVISDDFQVPINHMLAEAADASVIGYWYSEWIRSGASIPDEFVTDMSLALIGAAVRQFTPHMTISDYIQTLFEMHNNKGQSKTPGCFIRIDFAHLMKAVATTRHLRNVPKKVKDFFIRSVALLAKKTSLLDAKQHIYAVFVVALSSTEGCNEDDQNIPAEICKKNIIHQIMGIESSTTDIIDRINTEVEDELRENPDEDEEISSRPDDPEAPRKDDVEKFSLGDCSFSLWIQQLRKEAETTIARYGLGDRDNLMFHQNFAKYFAKLCSLLPLWSGVNCKFFNLPYETSSSGNSESNFKNEKQCMQGLIPCSVDIFVKQHIDLTAAAITVASQKYVTYIGKNVTNTEDCSDTMNDNPEDTSDTISVNEDVDDGNNKDFTDSVGDCFDYSSNKGVSHTATKAVNDCVACKNNDFPTGAHVCYLCHKKVHILRGCSISMNDEEGYGERRICIACSVKPVYLPPSQTEKLATELNYKSKWKRKATKGSIYTKLCINWDLNTNINKKAKIGLLRNGNLARTTYSVGKTKVALTDTCVFDSIAQILAAAYSYYESYREVAENSQDEIFEIAILLAKNANQKKINSLRTKLLFKLFKKTSCAFVVAPMISATLKNTTSFSEIRACHTCQYEKETGFPFVSMQLDKLQNNMENLEDAIAENLKIPMICHKCKTPSKVTRIFGRHLFIEMPVSSVDPNINDDEIIISYELSDLKLSIEVEFQKYILLGLILFQPPLLEGGIGHYTAAIRINQDFEVYDDLRNKPFTLKRNANVVIHSLFYFEDERTKN